MISFGSIKKEEERRCQGTVAVIEERLESQATEGETQLVALTAAEELLSMGVVYQRVHRLTVGKTTTVGTALP